MSNLVFSNPTFANGTLSFQVQADLSIGNFDLVFTYDSTEFLSSDDAITVSGPASGWFVSSNIISPGQLLIAGAMTNEQPMTAGSTLLNFTFKLASASDTSVTLGYGGSINDPPQYIADSSITLTGSALTGKTVDFLAYSWKQHILLDIVDIREAGANPRYSDNTGVDHDGKASFASVSDASLSLSASRSIQSTETTATNAAVNLQDAIAILKMIVGLPVNGTNQPMSPYQAYAADYDGNGTVALTDAIGVLKHVVGLTAPDPQWVFFNEADTTVAGKYNSTTKTVTDPTHPGAVPALMANLTGDSPVHVGLAGVLRGDVDGSYMGGGTLDMDALQSSYANYFQSTDHGLNPVQFGIYA